MKKTKEPKPKPYPIPQRTRAGCKVSFYYYTGEAQARDAANVAKFNRAVYESRGFDFGYRSPGECRRITEGEYAGMWEVVIP